MLDIRKKLCYHLGGAFFMPEKSSRKYPYALILQILQQYETHQSSPKQLAIQYDISYNTIKYWIKEFKKNGYLVFGGNKRVNRHMTYNGTYKVKVVEYWIAHPELSSYKISEMFHTSTNATRTWRKLYIEKGKDALLKETRGANRKMERQEKIVQSKKTQKEKIEELENQIAYLKVENEYLKKLNALACKEGH